MITIKKELSQVILLSFVISILAMMAGCAIPVKCGDDSKADDSHKMNENENREPNRLINEKSPYLLQHAYNPIDWYAWGDDAFAKAAAEDKPIFLSIGYSSCHWCHVMEEESFEDDEVAEFMNEHFVSIKVDREERPDIDSIYMTVCQVMTGSGGWPLTIVMTPDKKPFFAGTYFPKESKYGRPGLLELLKEIDSKWRTERERLVEVGDQMSDALSELSAYKSGDTPTVKDLTNAYRAFESRFDGTYGGFNPAPKFPSPHNLMFLLRYHLRTGESDALVMVERTLQMMRRGGIWDHIGLGFHRYSTDPVWLVPHFEKMLYDQAMLAMAYTEAYQATGKEEYASVARDIFTYVLRDMTSPEGGFYSAEDADSEGEEGTFYVWKTDEVESILDDESARIFIRAYGMTSGGNFDGNTNIIYMARDFQKLASDNGMSIGELEKNLAESRAKLFEVREKREHPFKDDKILTDWNGLMIAALAKGAWVLGEEEYSDAASKAASFLLDKMRNADGRLLHRYRDGEAGIYGYIDDYAFLTWSLLELYEATFNVEFLETSMQLSDEMIRLFRDNLNGGFFFTGSDAEELIARTREIYDGAVPSGNSVAAMTLLRLGRISGRSEYEEIAHEIFSTFGEPAKSSPTGFALFLSGLDFGIGPSMEIVIAGDPEDASTKTMLDTIRSRFMPNSVVILNTGESDVGRLIPFVLGQGMIDGKATAYVCRNYACKAPVTDVESLIESLDDGIG